MQSLGPNDLQNGGLGTMNQGVPNPIFQSATEAFLGDSETPTPVRVGQLKEDVLILPREEYRKQSAIQKQKDAEAESQRKMLAEQKPGPSPPPGLPGENAPFPKVPSGAQPSGKRLRARRTISPPVPKPKLDPNRQWESDLEDRIAKMEVGQVRTQKALDTVIEILSRQPVIETREEKEEVDDAAPRVLTDDEIALADASVPDDEDEELPAPDDEDDVDQDLCDTFMGAEDSFEPGDPNIARMQAFIQRKTPIRDFRRFWAQLVPKGAFQEWPPAMQARFTGLFNTIIIHPKMLAQVRRTVLTFRNGQVMGEEQMYKMLVMLAGNCAIYSIVTSE